GGGQRGGGGAGSAGRGRGRLEPVRDVARLPLPASGQAVEDAACGAVRGTGGTGPLRRRPGQGNPAGGNRDGAAWRGGGAGRADDSLPRGGAGAQEGSLAPPVHDEPGRTGGRPDGVPSAATPRAGLPGGGL